MNREPLVFGGVVVGVVLGLLGLLVGEATGGDRTLVWAGGIVVLFSVGVLTVQVARLAPDHG